MLFAASLGGLLPAPPPRRAPRRARPSDDGPAPRGCRTFVLGLRLRGGLAEHPGLMVDSATLGLPLAHATVVHDIFAESYVALIRRLDLEVERCGRLRRRGYVRSRRGRTCVRRHGSSS